MSWYEMKMRWKSRAGSIPEISVREKPTVPWTISKNDWEEEGKTRGSIGSKNVPIIIYLFVTFSDLTCCSTLSQLLKSIDSVLLVFMIVWVTEMTSWTVYLVCSGWLWRTTDDQQELRVPYHWNIVSWSEGCANGYHWLHSNELMKSIHSQQLIENYERWRQWWRH